VPGGEAGDLYVKGDSALALYWAQHEKTKRSILGDWFFTGDRYRVDEDGYYWYEGRSDDMIKVSGLWASPIEIESVLLEHAAVAESAVVGIDVQGFTKIKAFVITKGGAVADDALVAELQEHCKSRLQRFQYPHIIEFIARPAENGHRQDPALQAPRGRLAKRPRIVPKHIAVLPCDGAGKEVVPEAIKVLKAAGADLEFEEFDVNADAYLRTGYPITKEVWAEVAKADSILFGAVGDSRVNDTGYLAGVLLRLRFELDLYVNLRPAKLYDDRLSPLRREDRRRSISTVRENTRLYVGMGGVQERDA
jgi:hypothetical protein